MSDDKKPKVVLCVPTVTRPAQPCLDAIAASVPVLDGICEHFIVNEIGCPYISAARAYMLRKALDVKADVIVFIDHDLSWEPDDLRLLIETPGEVVSGNYRYKRDEEAYMGTIIPAPDGKPIVREDGAILMHSVPAGFLKVTRGAVQAFMRAYPELLYGEPDAYWVDLFNHGAHDGVWWGEDFAFSRRWREQGGKIWCVPQLTITHHAISFKEGHTYYTPYAGNFGLWLAGCPGGSRAA